MIELRVSCLKKACFHIDMDGNTEFIFIHSFWGNDCYSGGGNSAIESNMHCQTSMDDFLLTTDVFKLRRTLCTFTVLLNSRWDSFETASFNAKWNPNWSTLLQTARQYARLFDPYPSALFCLREDFLKLTQFSLFFLFRRQFYSVTNYWFSCDWCNFDSVCCVSVGYRNHILSF